MRLLAVLLPLGIVATVLGAPLWYKVDKHTNYRNLRVVDPGILYRSGQLTPEALDRTRREKDIKTVISLREKNDDSTKDIDRFEERFCHERGMMYHRLDVPVWNVQNGVVPGEKPLREFLSLVNNPGTPKPILVHCFAGEHRTGALVAVYRMECNGWTNSQAIDEMTSMGNSRTKFDDVLLGYIRNYKPTSKRVGGQPNPD